MENPAPVIRKNSSKSAGLAVEIVLVLVIACLAACVAAVFILRPIYQSAVAALQSSELTNDLAISLVRASILPGQPGVTCETAVETLGNTYSTTNTWTAAKQESNGKFLVTLKMVNAVSSATYNWSVDFKTREVKALDQKSVCPLP